MRRGAPGAASIVLALAILVGGLARAAPALYGGAAFNPSAYPLLRDAEILASDPELDFMADPRMDGYNNLWPGPLLVLSTLIQAGLPGGAYYSLVSALVDAAAVAGVYALALRVSRGRRLESALAAVAVALAPGLVVEGAGPTRESLARPLYYGLLLASLRGDALALPLAAGLGASHHLTSVSAAVALALGGLSAKLSSLASGSAAPSLRRGLAASIVAVAATSVFYSMWADAPRPGAADLVVLGVYAAGSTLMLVSAAYLSPRGSRGGLGLGPALVLAAAAGYVLLLAVRGTAPGVQRLGFSVYGYSLPWLAGIVVAASSARSRDPLVMLAAGGFLAVAGLGLGVHFTGALLGSTPAARLLALALPLAAVASSHSRRVAAGMAAAGLIGLVVVGPGIVAGSDTVVSWMHVESCDLAVVGLSRVAHGDVKAYYLSYYLWGDPYPLAAPNPQGPTILFDENLLYGLRYYDNLLAGDPGALRMLAEGGARARLVSAPCAVTVVP